MEPSMDEVLNSTKTEYRILLEIKLLMSEFVTGGIYLMSQKSNSMELEGIFFVRSGVFKNGIFRFFLTLSPSYPNQTNAPIIKLAVPLVHPLVDPETLIFDSSSAFPVWTSDEHLYELLKFFKYSFENLDYSCAITDPPPKNQIAVELYNNDRDKFLEKAKETVTQTINENFAPNETEVNKNQHVFTYDKSIEHDQILENMKSFTDSSLENFSFSFERRG